MATISELQVRHHHVEHTVITPNHAVLHGTVRTTVDLILV
jgi:hypothetical protein